MTHTVIAVEEKSASRASASKLRDSGTSRRCDKSMESRLCIIEGLLLIQDAPRVQLVEVEDGIEDQEIAPVGFAAPDGVVREEHHVPLVVRDVDDCRVLRDFASALCEP